MTLDASACYRALRARDARFDGRFFVAVRKTRVYCRPVCTAKTPRRGLAASLRTTDRHLRRTFKASFGVSPVAYAQTQRLLLAKGLLTDTALSATDVAFASGFGSVRRFNALFKQRYRLNPRELRDGASRCDAQVQSDGLSFALAFRPPYDWEALLSFLAARTVDGVEEVDDGSYRRSVRIDRGGKSHAGWVGVAPARKAPSHRCSLA